MKTTAANESRANGLGASAEQASRKNPEPFIHYELGTFKLRVDIPTPRIMHHELGGLKLRVDVSIPNVILTAAPSIKVGVREAAKIAKFYIPVCTIGSAAGCATGNFIFHRTTTILNGAIDGAELGVTLGIGVALIMGEIAGLADWVRRS